MKKEDFVIDYKGIKVLDSVYCELSALERKLDSPLLSPQLAETLKEQLAKINKLIKPARDFETAEWDRESNFYSDEADRMQLDSVWCVPGIKDFNTKHSFKGAKFVQLEDKALSIGDTWESLWRVSDDLIKICEYQDHIFIEGFTRKGDVLDLSLGS